jgi:hypothetical protein
VARRIGQDELAARGREIPVGDVDRDAPFALRPQPGSRFQAKDLPTAVLSEMVVEREGLAM